MPYRILHTLLLITLVVSGANALAETLACHLTYGGKTQTLEAQPIKQPAATPYTAKATPIGSFFLFRPLFIAEPTDLASIHLYTYANLDGGPLPLHHASYAYPPTPSANSGNQRYGFTGLQRIYEPERDSELQYWCEMKVTP